MSGGLKIPGFRDLRPIGSGAFADVYAATHVSLGRPVAIKILRERTPSLTQTDRFRREREVLAKVSHPHVLRVHEAGSAEGRLFVVTELLTGGTLEDKLKDGLEREAGLDLVRQAARGVEALHAAGLVHRDLKPSNLLLDDEGRVKVADLGLVAGLELNTLTRSQDLTGTPAYLAPEQCKGGGARDATSDVYSLGAILYEVLTGAQPHSGGSVLALFGARMAEPDPDPRRKVPELAPELASVVRTAMAGDPARRYRDAGAFARALEAARRSANTPRPPEAAIALGAALAAAFAAACLVAVWSWQAGAPPAAGAQAELPPPPDTPLDLGGNDPDTLAARLADGDPSARSPAAAWIAAHPADAASARALERAARIGALRAPPLRAVTLPAANPAHVPQGLARSARELVWIELCPYYCDLDHRGPPEVALLVDDGARDLGWGERQATAVDASWSYVAELGLGNSSGVFRLRDRALERVAELPWGRTTALCVQGATLVAGSKDGRVAALDRATGAVVWERQVHQGAVTGIVGWGDDAVVSVAHDGRATMRWLGVGDGSERPWPPTVPPVGEVKWALGMREPDEVVLCLNETNIVYGVGARGSRTFVGERDIDATPASIFGQWSPDALSARTAARCGDMLLIAGCRWTDAEIYSQYRGFDLTDGHEVFAADVRDAGLYTLNLGPSGLLTTGIKTLTGLRVEVRELELPRGD
ncbi:MAG: protein kinase [Planctomycetota bacterium]